MSKKRRGQWQADLFKGFMEGWSPAIDPFGVVIQAVGVILKKDWRTIGGIVFWKKDPIVAWVGKFISLSLMAYFVYSAWPTDWHWIVALAITIVFLNILGIWWRATHPVVEANDPTEEPGPDVATLEKGLSSPVEPIKPQEIASVNEEGEETIEESL